MKNFYDKLAKIAAAIKLDIVSHMSAFVLAAGYFAEHGDALAKVLHNADLAATIANACVLIGVLGLYANGVTATSNLMAKVIK